MRRVSSESIPTPGSSARSKLYFDRFDDDAAAGWRLHQDVEPTLRRLALDGYRLALVSGRPEAIVRFRLERLGIGGYFARGTGAFGCEADTRDDCSLALWRSACTPRRAVLATDASRDLSGVTAIAVRSLTELPALLSERHAAFPSSAGRRSASWSTAAWPWAVAALR